MRIHQIRLGHATNSSSSHSIVVLPDQYVPASDNDPYIGGAYGWDTFTLVSPQAKDDYLAVMLHDALEQLDVPQPLRQVIVQSWLGVTVQDDSYIDHQSHISLPRAWRGGSLDAEFFTAFREALHRPNVAILGGNDNGGEHPLDKYGKALLPASLAYGPFVSRRDPAGYWTLFNQHTGAKIRLTLGDHGVPVSAHAPELVDVKLTDDCPFGCAFCYQGSAPNGQHAPLSRLERLAEALGNLRCFEVALGGGEPTLHPQFPAIVKAFADHGVTVNFTTRNRKWFHQHPDVLQHLNQRGGAFAFSTESANEAERFLAECEAAEVDRRHIHLQTTLGVIALPELEKLLRVAHANNVVVTLLAFKHTGRGLGYSPLDANGWLDVVRRLSESRACPRLGIDTPLARDYRMGLRVLGVPDYLYETEEGRYSMYVDAVHAAAGPSSYTGETLDSLPLDADVPALQATVLQRMAQYAHGG